MVTYWACHYNLETSLENFMTDEEFSRMSHNEFLPNRNWWSVSFRSDHDAKAWKKAQNDWLWCAWTPNQSVEERSRNAADMKSLEVEMKKLEIQ